MDPTSVADAGGGERHTGGKRLIRLFKGHEACMPIGHRVGPLRDGRERKFFDGGVLLNLNEADRGAAFTLNEEVDAWHAAHAYPKWAMAFLDRPWLDTVDRPVLPH